jgi:glutaredoxin
LHTKVRADRSLFSIVIIFSKSYCPHSRRAKGILLDKYIIDPVPVVVELDKHPMGSRLQDQLEIMTGRRTVPNVLIDGISIGGGDDVAALDNSHALIEKVRLLAGKKLDDIKLRPIDDEEGHGLR